MTIQLRGGINVFQYAPNPTGWIDPLGLARIHGNWCGPDWTGGRVEQYSTVNDRNNHYAEPVSLLDAVCQRHDKCYERCRINNRCSGTTKYNCMVTCNDVLVDESWAINNDDDPNSTRAMRRIVERGVATNKGADSNIESDCPNYVKPKPTYIEKLKDLF